MKGCEYFMTDEEFYRIYTFLKSRYGIDMGQKKEIVVGRMEHYIKMKGYPSYTAYMNALEKDITGKAQSRRSSRKGQSERAKGTNTKAYPRGSYFRESISKGL